MPSSVESLFWIALVAVLAPLVAGLVPRRLVPEVVLLLALGMVIGPFGAWLLGPLGALLAVPLSLLVRALLVESDPGARWALPLISGKPDEDQPATVTAS
jgi:hypothetical protein